MERWDGDAIHAANGADASSIVVRAGERRATRSHSAISPRLDRPRSPDGLRASRRRRSAELVASREQLPREVVSIGRRAAGHELGPRGHLRPEHERSLRGRCPGDTRALLLGSQRPRRLICERPDSLFVRHPGLLMDPRNERAQAWRQLHRQMVSAAYHDSARELGPRDHARFEPERSLRGQRPGHAAIVMLGSQCPHLRAFVRPHSARFGYAGLALECLHGRARAWFRSLERRGVRMAVVARQATAERFGRYS